MYCPNCQSEITVADARGLPRVDQPKKYWASIAEWERHLAPWLRARKELAEDVKELTAANVELSDALRVTLQVAAKRALALHGASCQIKELEKRLRQPGPFEWTFHQDGTVSDEHGRKWQRVAFAPMLSRRLLAAVSFVTGLAGGLGGLLWSLL